MLVLTGPIVDDEGTIRLLEPINIKEGTHVLVTLMDKDTLISFMVSSGATAYSEERLRAEMEEDEYWASQFKNLPSL